MYLYHYFDKRSGPFRSLTALSDDEAVSVLEKLKKERPGAYASQRNMSYIVKRRRCEDTVREKAAEKGVIMDIPSPHYMVVEACPWIRSWFEKPDVIAIPIEQFDTARISFTYGDSMPTFSPFVNDGKEYRRTVYTYDEILYIIEKYGLPQNWNSDGTKGIERYIEAQVWTDDPIAQYSDQ